MQQNGAAASKVSRMNLSELKTFREAAARLPRRRQGRPVHISTLHRWRAKGIRGIRLPALRVGGSWMTSSAALEWFFTQLSEPTPPGRDATITSPTSDHDLEDAGW
jgi:Protein of unknown function (DUF1580)